MAVSRHILSYHILKYGSIQTHFIITYILNGTVTETNCTITTAFYMKLLLTV